MEPAVERGKLNRAFWGRDAIVMACLICLSLSLIALLRFPILSNELHVASKRANFVTHSPNTDPF